MLEDRMQPASPTPLARSLGVAGVLFLTLSVTTPASSVFVIVPGMLQVAGTGAIWATLIAGIVCVATAYIYAELSSAWPVAGGEYVMVAQTLGPLAGFVMLGINVFNNLIFLPVAGLGIREVLVGVIPGLPQVPTAIVVVGACTLIGLLNIRINAIVTGAFLLIEIAALFAVTAFGLVEAGANPLGFLTDPQMLGAGGALVPASLTSIGVAASIAIFAFNGYGAAVYFGEEMHEAPNRIARSILWALVWTLLLEGVPLLAALMGAVDLPAVLASSNPFGELATRVGGGRAGQLIAFGVALAIVNAIIAWVLACARFFYGTARDGSWGRPFDAWMLAIHPRWQSPWIGTLMVGGVGMLLCFLPLRLLEVWSGAGLIAIYAGIALAAIVGRRKGTTGHGRYRMPLYPLAPIVTLIALALITWATWFDPEEGRPAIIATLVQIAIAAGYYLLVLRPRRWTAIIP
ncbi:APC family permease [Sphingomonas sp. NBWT7]|uniref:APC family permease n=1 Tax=Sphingomonas sp. NBWT7 TaxID=2596913 RepID=UPI001627ECA5|nr:APC family permease [Sphingomonas sp. NBWT7]QNE31244.1 APC family permease [Sphingomonas sp. NBWT7]